MRSTEATGVVGTLLSNMGEGMLEKAVKVGVQAAAEYMEEERKRQNKGRHDRRLRNTALLLRKYRTLKKHIAGAVFDARTAGESAVDILESLGDMSDDLYIESIKRSRQRTLIVLGHVEQMLRYFRIDCEEIGTEEAMRRYRIVMAMYVDEPKKTAEQIAAEENVAPRTVYRDIRAATPALSALIFGIDSLRMD